MDRSKDDLELGLRTVQVLATKPASVAGISVWRVAATVVGSQRLSGRATYFIARQGARLLRLALNVSEDPGSGLEHATGAFDYSAYGETVQVHLPARCHFVDVGAAALRTFVVEGQAMEPTLRSGQLIWVNSRAYRKRRPRRGDVIVFKAAPAGEPERDFIKRVIGLPG